VGPDVVRPPNGFSCISAILSLILTDIWTGIHESLDFIGQLQYILKQNSKKEQYM